MGWFTGSLFLFLPLRLCVRVWMCCNSFCVHGICLCVVTEYSQSGSLPPLSFSLLFRIRWCGKKKYVSGFCFLFCWSLSSRPKIVPRKKCVCFVFDYEKEDEINNNKNKKYSKIQLLHDILFTMSHAEWHCSCTTWEMRKRSLRERKPYLN